MPGHAILWILVTNGARAKVVMPDVVEGRFRTVLPLGTAEYPYAPPMLRDDGSGPCGMSFAVEVGQRLSLEAERGAFDRLVLVGPSHVLRDVRAYLSAAAQERLVGTLPRDCSRMTDPDLSPLVARWWVAPDGYGLHAM